MVGCKKKKLVSYNAEGMRIIYLNVKNRKCGEALNYVRTEAGGSRSTLHVLQHN